MEAFFSNPTYASLVLFFLVCLVLLSGFPVAFTLAGVSLLFSLFLTLIGVFDFSFLIAYPQRIFAIMTNEVLVAVPLFVFMGVMLERSRIAEELLDNMGRLFGSRRGGLGYSVCIVGALLAASTGIVGATVVTMGLLSLPTMLRRGYSPSLACGTICASGTLGQIIPPSIVLVLLGDQLSTAYQQAQYEMGNFAPDTVSVNDLFAGALLPGLALVGMYILYQWVVAWLNPDASPAIVDDEPIAVSTVLKSLFAPIALIIAVLGSILAGLASPTEAAAVGAIGSILLAGYRLSNRGGNVIVAGVLCFVALLALTMSADLRVQRSEISAGSWLLIGLAMLLSLALVVSVFVALREVIQARTTTGQTVLTDVMRQTTQVSSMVFVILVGASMFSLVFRAIGGDEVIEEFLLDIPGGTVTVLLIVMLVMFLMGFILDFLEIVFIVVPIVAPVLLTMEIAPGVPMDPIWLGVMMAINLQTSFLTPPFGFSLFYLRGVAPSSIKTMEIYKGVIPFVLIQVVMLLVLWFMPGLATWLPSLVY